MGAKSRAISALDRPVSTFQHCPLNLARGGNHFHTPVQQHVFAPDFVAPVTEDMRIHEMNQKMRNPMADVMAAAKAAQPAPKAYRTQEELTKSLMLATAK